jgi:hypothetical protein
MTSEGTCPTCGRSLVKTTAPAAERHDADTKPQKVPWHFKLLVVAITLYLTWRVVQLIQWLIHR